MLNYTAGEIPPPLFLESLIDLSIFRHGNRFYRGLVRFYHNFWTEYPREKPVNLFHASVTNRAAEFTGSPAYRCR